MSIPKVFKQYIDEDTYKDTSIALDILRNKQCPLYLQAEYIVNHPSVLKRGNFKTLLETSRDIDNFNKKIMAENVNIYYKNHPFEPQHYEPKLEIVKPKNNIKSNKKVLV